MAVSNQDATQAEELTKMLSQIAQTKTKPDADLPYLIQLESLILTKLREPFVAAQQQAYGGAAPGGLPNPVMHGPPGVPGGMPQAGPPGLAGGPPLPSASLASPGGGVNGVQSMASLPPVDEIRRMLSAGKK